MNPGKLKEGFTPKTADGFREYAGIEKIRQLND